MHHIRSEHTKECILFYLFISDIECPSFNITDIPESRLSHGYKIGTEANFTCPRGFELIGEIKLTCLSNGMDKQCGPFTYYKQGYS